MKRKKKILISIVAGVLALATILGCILAVVVPSKPKDKTSDDGIAFDELFVRDVLENLTVDDIINDPKWGENLADSTDNYIMVMADKFDYVEHTGMNGGYSMLYFNTNTKDIEMIQHSLVSYVEDEAPKTAVEKVEKYADEKKDDKAEDSDWVVKQSGAMIYFGTKAAIKAAK